MDKHIGTCIECQDWPVALAPYGMCFTCDSKTAEKVRVRELAKHSAEGRRISGNAFLGSRTYRSVDDDAMA